MTEKIRTRTFQYGNEKESEWPPIFGTAKGQGFQGYWDIETQSFKEGRPPNRNHKFGDAPMYISDEMPETRHPKTGEMVSSRSKWNQIDKATGCFTTGSKEDSGAIKKKKNIEAEDRDMLNRIDRAVAMIDDGTAPLSEKTRELCKQENERLSSTLGFDAGNVLGRNKNARTKRYSRK